LWRRLARYGRRPEPSALNVIIREFLYWTPDASEISQIIVPKTDI